MEKIMSKLGTWSVQTGEILKGLVGADLRAYCLAGSEDDVNYEVHGSITIVSGTSASVIVLYSEDVGFTERYVECMLDVANQKLKIDLVNGAERVTVASRNYTLAVATEYAVDVLARIASDGSYYVVFSVNGVEQVRIEDLGAMYAAGMHGFACVGTAAQYTTFSNLSFLEQEYSTLTEVKAILRITTCEHDAEVSAAIKDADAKINNTLQNYEDAPLSSVPDSINRASKYLAAALYLQLNPLSQTMKEQAAAFNEIALKFLSEYISETHNAGAIS